MAVLHRVPDTDKTHAEVHGVSCRSPGTDADRYYRGGLRLDFHNRGIQTVEWNMTKTEFKEVLDSQHRILCLLTATKGEEYSRDDDQLANFKRSANEAGITPEQAWLVFFNKHADAIKHYIKNGAVKGAEPIEGRINDAILYLALFKGLVYERNADTAGGVEV